MGSVAKDIGQGFKNPISWVAPLGGITPAVIGRGERKERQRQEAINAKNAGIGGERYSLLQEGLRQGRERGQELFGQDQEQTGQDIQSIIQDRRDMTNMPSRAESAIRSSGQNQQRKIRSAGGSDAQQRQAQIDTERTAGMQGDIDKERRLQDFQQLMGNVAAMQSALEPAYGQLSLASQYIPPPDQQKGIFDKLFTGLGL